ncbi:MAG: DUF58 domain-containing protein [Candidatus Gracilibacteria bacterium]|nr:DUF58 domain-containing protein [Candidatus Gracilibacteria bacterium]
MSDNKNRLLELKTNALVDSLFIGNYKTSFKGRGIEFATYKEYDFSDSVKNIDFVKSDREGKILVKLFEEERELSVYFLIDLNDSFFNIGLKNEKIDLVYELIYLIGFSAIKNGDKVGAFIFDSNKKNINIAKKGKQNFINIVNNLDKFTNYKEGFNIKDLFRKKTIEKIDNNGLNYFNSLRIKNSLVFYLSDKLDIDLKDLKILGVKNDLIFCNIFNSFENNLSGDGISGLTNGTKNIFLDLDNLENVKKYIELRKFKINELRKFVLRNGGRYILLDETKNIYKEFYKLF